MRFSFLLKILLGAILVALFDRLFPIGLAGTAIGVFAGGWLIALLIGRRDVRRDRRVWVPIAVAALLVAALVDDPGVLGWVLFWSALSVAALLPRAAGFDGAWHWGAWLALHGVTGIVTPIADVSRMVRQRRDARVDFRAIAVTIAFPLIGGLLFIALFAAANPVIEAGLAAVRLPSFGRMLIWVTIFAGVWPSLRPHRAVMRLAARLPDPEPVLPGTSLPSVLIALALFNAIFAVQNALDIAFLWNGGPLPTGMTQTEYVHRGAYPLIATALIAGVMALAMLRPGSASERHPWARRLVMLWVTQNVILVASSALRTIDYVDTSMLTGLRIAALLWMGLVALGLMLIGWRILKAKSARWLINRNALAAAVVLIAGAFADLGAIAAGWNVRHQPAGSIDLCYLWQVGDGALIPLIELEGQSMDARTRDRLYYVRDRVFDDLNGRQYSWTHWTPRGARRLATARRLLGPAPAHARALREGETRNCDGSVSRLPDSFRP